uniref:Uncharacterized protein n=1 Tax=Vitis vinifera TaxID=29760 RepID=F6HHC7_VITVI
MGLEVPTPTILPKETTLTSNPKISTISVPKLKEESLNETIELIRSSMPMRLSILIGVGIKP